MGVKKRVILDTNFLMLPAQFGVDVFGKLRELLEGEYELVTSRMALFELMRLSAGRGKDAGAARVALKLVEERKVAVEESAEPVDDWLTAEGKKGAIVCTNDGELILRLKRGKVKCVRLRGKTRIGFA